MNRTRRSPIDILGITLGVVVILVVVGSIALIARGRTPGFQWNDLGMGRMWDKSAHPGPTQAENDEVVSGDFATVEIRNIAGSIEVHSGTVPGVRVHSVKNAMFPAALEKVTVAIEKRGNRLLVEERHDGGFFMSAGTVSFDITIPQGVKVIEAHSVSGSVTIHDVPAGVDQTLTTVSGSISTARARNLDASSTSGSIQFLFDGSRLQARSVSGSIQGRIEGMDKGGSVGVRTVSGSVDVEAFPDLDAKVALSSVSGGVSCELPLVITQQRRNLLEGKTRDGAGRLEVSTTSGPITIRRM